MRRSLRRLPLTPQRPQRRATKYKPADGQRWQDEEFPQFLRRARELGALIACADQVRPSCAERFRAHLGPVRSDPRCTGSRRALPPPPAGGQQPGGPALGHTAGRSCHGGGLPGVSGADRGGSGPEDSAGGGQLQYSSRPDNPGVAASKPSRGRAVLSADLLAASQSCGTARGLGPAAGPSRAEQDRSTASRQPGSCFPVFAKSPGTGASLLARGRLQVYSG